MDHVGLTNFCFNLLLESLNVLYAGSVGSLIILLVSTKHFPMYLRAKILQQPINEVKLEQENNYS